MGGALLRESGDYKFKERPWALEADRGVFREDIKVRREYAPGRDKWQNSGGKKGSTVWPAGEDARVRCQYGKITRQGQAPLRMMLEVPSGELSSTTKT